ncbi:hypothetical protein A7P98_02750 [Eikenella sp. NML080894]|uniref:NGO_0222 family membrane protein n=1 Tax=Eikenella TaxID=538 RepID=UPI0007DE7404|nr:MULTISPECIES: NGO_0222 family membrane protein [Eikenella]OAM36878.1 hypothetical protein A7P98_02750 [Eikenella sp. NML080894]OAM39959.1 hypothetical protein A7P99_01815 [Eikenella sp. NML120348]OAM46094.1 hypothetical protein A7Q03_02090 [Eikenella sp. NML99-0057]
MNKTRRYLKLTALFTILFILLLLAGNVLFILKYTAAAVACFLAAFLCMAGQMASLAKFLREKQLVAQQMQQAVSQQVENEAQPTGKEVT